MGRDQTKFMVAGLVFCIVLDACIWRVDQPEGICVDRDMPATERMFSACITAQSKHNSHAAYDCRQEAERLACKSWSRP